MTLKCPFIRGPRHPLFLKLIKDAPEFVPVNFYLLEGGIVEDIMRKIVIFFVG